MSLPPLPKVPLPKSVPYILSNEFCERFSFYGLKAILPLYLVTVLNFSEDQSTSWIHGFIFISYTCTLPGGLLADSWLGKYRTILSLSVVYLIGSILLSVTSVPAVSGPNPHWWGVALSLILIAAGTGGIKSSVSSFIGDQFQPEAAPPLLESEDPNALLYYHQERARQQKSIFSWFYLTINAGSLLSTFVTPLLRSYVSFWVAFGVPAVLLSVAILLFFSGRNSYYHVPPGGNLVFSLTRIFISAFRNYRKGIVIPMSNLGESKSQTFLDYAKADQPEELVDDLKMLVGVTKVFIAIPVFWALFDQHASRWVFQSRKMDLEVFNSSGFQLKLEPDQLPTLNPLLLVMFIPVFDKVVYRFISLRPIARMCWGMLLTSLSFVAAGLLDLLISASEPNSIPVFLQLPQYVLLGWGEIMVSITGLELAYTQAPSSMKSVVMSVWQLTVAVGNLLVATLAEIHFLKQQYMESFFYAGLMLVFLFIFFVVNRNYKYVEEIREKEGIEMEQNADEQQ